MSMQAITKQTGATIKGGSLVSKRLKKADSFVNKCMNDALRGEGFELRKALKKDIKQGRAGGQIFSPLSAIAKRLARYVQGPGYSGIRQRQNRKALDRLAEGVRYDVNRKPPFAVAVGWVGPQTWMEADLNLGIIGRGKNRHFSDSSLSINPLGRGISRGNITSKRWRQLASMHQDGFTRRITREQRRYLARRGAGLGIAEGEDTPFFLRKTTKFFKTPARPIINPFWRAHKAAAFRGIDKKFKTKLKGLKF